MFIGTYSDKRGDAGMGAGGNLEFVSIDLFMSTFMEKQVHHLKFYFDIFLEGRIWSWSPSATVKHGCKLRIKYTNSLVCIVFIFLRTTNLNYKLKQNEDYINPSVYIIRTL